MLLVASELALLPPRAAPVFEFGAMVRNAFSLCCLFARVFI